MLLTFGRGVRQPVRRASTDSLWAPSVTRLDDTALAGYHVDPPPPAAKDGAWAAARPASPPAYRPQRRVRPRSSSSLVLGAPTLHQAACRRSARPWPERMADAPSAPGRGPCVGCHA